MHGTVGASYISWRLEGCLAQHRMDDDITDDMLAPGPAPVNDTAVLLPDSPPLLNSKGPAEAFTTIGMSINTTLG